MAVLYLSLGSNLGNRQDNLDSALRLIGLEIGTIAAASDVIETQPWGFKSNNAFLNMAVKVNTELDALGALHATQDIERRLGRTQKSMNGVYHDRTIDIDLLIYDDVRMETAELTLPHPRMWEREFVRVPLLQIAPELAKD